MKTPYKTVPPEEVFADFTAEERKQVQRRTSELLAEELALRDLRRSRQLTQVEVARRLGGRQVYISRLEQRADMKLSTLRDFVGAIGGDLHLVVTFPEGETVRLRDIGESGKPSPRTRAATRARAGEARRPAAKPVKVKAR